MPLRDHFRSPVNDRHRWDALHGLLPAMIVVQLEKLLPTSYTIGPQIHIGGSVEIDVGAREMDVESAWTPDRDNGDAGGWVATLPGLAARVETEPSLSIETDIPDADDYEVLIYEPDRDARLVAAIEVVSPSNKDRPESRHRLITKCAALLKQDVSVTLIDLVTVQGFNLYADLLRYLRRWDNTVPTPPPATYATACRVRRLTATSPTIFEAWNHNLVVGQTLPNLPIWLNGTFSIRLDLESAYEETCRVLRIA